MMGWDDDININTRYGADTETVCVPMYVYVEIINFSGRALNRNPNSRLNRNQPFHMKRECVTALSGFDGGVGYS